MEPHISIPHQNQTKVTFSIPNTLNSQFPSLTQQNSQMSYFVNQGLHFSMASNPNLNRPILTNQNIPLQILTNHNHQLPFPIYNNTQLPIPTNNKTPFYPPTNYKPSLPILSNQNNQLQYSPNNNPLFTFIDDFPRWKVIDERKIQPKKLNFQPYNNNINSDHKSAIIELHGVENPYRGMVPPPYSLTAKIRESEELKFQHGSAIYRGTKFSSSVAFIFLKLCSIL